MELGDRSRRDDEPVRPSITERRFEHGASAVHGVEPGRVAGDRRGRPWPFARVSPSQGDDRRLQPSDLGTPPGGGTGMSELIPPLVSLLPIATVAVFLVALRW